MNDDEDANDLLYKNDANDNQYIFFYRFLLIMDANLHVRRRRLTLATGDAGEDGDFVQLRHIREKASGDNSLEKTGLYYKILECRE